MPVSSILTSKRRWLWYSLLAVTLLATVVSIMEMSNRGSSSVTGIPPHECRPTTTLMPKDGCVPDEATAKRIAEAVWLSVYGETIYQKEPFRAELLGDSLWAVAGSLPKDMLGGVPYIEIQKEDGRILGIGHGK